jgi:hypothetical protein
MPIASLAATNARGYPVAFEASADERDRRAFTYTVAAAVAAAVASVQSGVV